MGWSIESWGEFDWGPLIDVVLNGGAIAGWASLMWQILLKVTNGPKCKVVRHALVKAYTTGPEFNFGIELIIRNKGNEAVSIDELKLYLKVDDNELHLPRLRQTVNTEGNGFDALPEIFDLEPRKSGRIWAIFQNQSGINISENIEYKLLVSFSNGKVHKVNGRGIQLGY